MGSVHIVVSTQTMCGLSIVSRITISFSAFLATSTSELLGPEHSLYKACVMHRRCGQNQDNKHYKFVDYSTAKSIIKPAKAKFSYFWEASD